MAAACLPPLMGARCAAPSPSVSPRVTAPGAAPGGGAQGGGREGGQTRQPPRWTQEETACLGGREGAAPGSSCVSLAPRAGASAQRGALDGRGAGRLQAGSLQGGEGHSRLRSPLPLPLKVSEKPTQTNRPAGSVSRWEGQRQTAIGCLPHWGPDRARNQFMGP